MAVSEAGIKLVAEGVDAYERDIKRADNATQDFAKNTEGSKGKFEGWSSIVRGAFEKVGGMVTEQLANAGKALVSFGVDSVKLAGEFEGNGATSLGGALKALTDSFGKLFSTITADGDESTSTLESLANALESVAGGINAIANAYSKARSIGGRVLDFLTIDPGEGPKFADSSLGKAFGYTKGGTGQSSMSGGTTIIMNGVVDGESARRSIEKVMQTSSRRTGAVNLNGGSL